MKKPLWKLATIFLLALSLALFGSATVLAKGKPPAEAGNNLSFPVIWSEGVEKVLPGMPGMDPMLTGEWWYQWGTNGVDPNITPASCPPDPDNASYCDDGIPGAFDVTLIPGVPLADNPQDLAKAYLQKDLVNTWQAWSGTPEEAMVAEPSGELYVDWIDWGDNLESVDWYTRSQVRTEVVLFQDLPTAMLEYEMRHVSGWGIDEVHGLAATPAGPPIAIEGPGTQATVYSPCARLTIQKLLLQREYLVDGSLTWVSGSGWTETDPLGADLINGPIFNMAVHEAQARAAFRAVAREAR